MHLLPLLCILSVARAASLQGWTTIDINQGEWNEVIERDVCVIGGGASGTHAAVSLVDSNKTVVIVERNNYLGGHTHTYVDPETGVTVDIGVVIFQPVPAVFRFFERFQVPLVNISSLVVNSPGQPANKSIPAEFFATVRVYADFRDGSAVTRDLPSAADQADALARLAQVLAQYEYLLYGYDIPDPVPEDLYLPFGAFLEKYNVTAAFPTIYSISQGMGDLLHISTIYAIKYFNLDDLKYSSEGYLTQAQGNNSLLYTRAAEFLTQKNILFESSVVSTNRHNPASGRPELLVSTRNGLKLLSCGQILLTIPPTLTNLRGWDLSVEEHEVFSQYITANGYWTGLVKGVGMNKTVSNRNSAANMPFNIPVLPALYDLSAVGALDDVWWIKFGANSPTMTDAGVKSYIERQIATMQLANNVPVTKPEWLVFESHTPFHLQVAPQAIEHGFFRDLTALQGGFGARMFYSGAAFHTQHSTLLWRFNEEVVIPRMLKTVEDI